ncbi:hypothetical protein [Reyranella sp. CPCC 100927]|uniref:hypothetical protein n=1 Tax=Reyranella sp. CPCC 100927 TaxID=2599616 RepID=UPI0011B8084E|nr:hypothetical protein [Reyranella sp. CPCC 100927]
MTGLESVRRDHGGPATDGIRESDMIQIAGDMPISVGGAVALGWLIESSPGTYEETALGRQYFGKAPFNAADGTRKPNSSAQQGKTDDNSDPAPEPIERLSDEAEHILAAHATTVGAHGANASIEVLYLNEGEIPDAFAGQLAAKTGLSPDEVRVQMTTVTTEYEKQAHIALGLSGDAAQEAVNWLWENRGMEMREAVGELVLMRSIKALKELGEAYARRR